jgi:hypothetical protein
MGDQKMKTCIVILALLLMETPICAQELSITKLDLRSDRLEIEITLNNQTGQDLFMVSPSQTERAKTRYFLNLDEQTKELQVNRLFYSYPAHAIIEGDPPCLTLTRVLAGQTYKDTISLMYPNPANNLPIPQMIDLRRVASIRFQLGIFPFDAAIDETQRTRPFGRCAVAQDRINRGEYKGQSLIQIQRVLAAQRALSGS